MEHMHWKNSYQLEHSLKFYGTPLIKELRLATVFCYRTSLQFLEIFNINWINYSMENIYQNKNQKTDTCVVIYEHCYLT